MISPLLYLVWTFKNPCGVVGRTSYLGFFRKKNESGREESERLCCFLDLFLMGGNQFFMVVFQHPPRDGVWTLRGRLVQRTPYHPFGTPWRVQVFRSTRFFLSYVFLLMPWFVFSFEAWRRKMFALFLCLQKHICGWDSCLERQPPESTEQT